MPDAAMRVQLTTKEKADLIDVTQPWRLIGPVKSKALIDWTLRGVCEAYNKAEPIMFKPVTRAYPKRQPIRRRSCCSVRLHSLMTHQAVDSRQKQEHSSDQRRAVSR